MPRTVEDVHETAQMHDLIGVEREAVVPEPQDRIHVIASDDLQPCAFSQVAFARFFEASTHLFGQKLGHTRYSTPHRSLSVHNKRKISSWRNRQAGASTPDRSPRPGEARHTWLV